jgi:hypothetical protein
MFYSAGELFALLSMLSMITGGQRPFVLQFSSIEDIVNYQ